MGKQASEKVSFSLLKFYFFYIRAEVMKSNVLNYLVLVTSR